jgi:hypothetical protein
VLIPQLFFFTILSNVLIIVFASAIPLIVMVFFKGEGQEVITMTLSNEVVFIIFE